MTLVDIDAILAHELVGWDADGKLCACGVRSADWLEHLGEVALEALDAPPPLIRLTKAERKQAKRRAREDAEWMEEQQRLFNLGTFSRHPAPVRGNRRAAPIVPSGISKERALEVALRVLEESPDKRAAWRHAKPLPDPDINHREVVSISANHHLQKEAV